MRTNAYGCVWMPYQVLVIIGYYKYLLTYVITYVSSYLHTKQTAQYILYVLSILYIPHSSYMPTVRTVHIVNTVPYHTVP